ncbi:Uncharacterized conserved protein, DUF2141 family [Algoriphagus boritolerans DSM 17298 = JCM 18970]|uniref:Uncharacterized conserved protein, DUF2141 family n=2 Tax=Algoriphagus TaxID=246875 RepID=A0A1H6AR31_9BACT|nr:Uncharacterized conserved protein, DUF2141 family [Algoriphagus boritolerans DSM 17298 = JCM 18970]
MKFGYKICSFTILWVFAFKTSFSQDIQHKVVVKNLENKQGVLYVGWYKDPDTFRKIDKAIYRERFEVNHQTEVTVSFTNIPERKYAIAVFLDENDNYKLDTNLLGIPTEKYGFSNNILSALRPATFKESVFDLTHQEMIIHIKLK